MPEVGYMTYTEANQQEEFQIFWPHGEWTLVLGMHDIGFFDDIRNADTFQLM